MTDARNKLSEAEYFLDRMVETQADRDAFEYNLSAFLAAFRSVDYVMTAEFDDRPGFANWHRTQVTKVKADKGMKLLVDKRHLTIHKEPVKPRAEIEVKVSETIRVNATASVVVRHKDGTTEVHRSAPKAAKEPAAKSKTEIEWRWYFNELPDVDVVTLCQESVSKLDAIVAECEQGFT
jgi:hypothetical protein